MVDGDVRDTTKINIGYEYLEKEIKERIKLDFLSYQEQIKLFYLITLIRIVPYITHKSVFNNVKRGILKG